MSKPLADAERGLLKQARIAKLISAWANATRRLTPEEIAEVEAEHPGLINAQPPLTTAAAPFELHGAPPLPAKLRGYYLYPLKHYAAIYGYDANSGERTIKRFVGIGRNTVPHDLPPLDEPAKMPGWWRSHHPRREVPAGIRRAVALAVVNAPLATEPEPQQTPPPAPEPPTPRPPALPPAAESDRLDFPAQVDELRRVVTSHLHQLRAASAEEAPENLADSVDRAEWARSKAERVEGAQRNYKSSLEMLRKAENDLVEWQKSHGELAPRSTVATEVSRIVGAIHAAVKRLTKNVRPRLAGKSDAEQDTIWDDEVRKCFRILAGSKFASPLDE